MLLKMFKDHTIRSVRMQQIFKNIILFIAIAFYLITYDASSVNSQKALDSLSGKPSYYLCP